MALKDVRRYIGNVSKSFSYAGLEVLGDKAPVVKSLADSNREAIDLVGRSIRDSKEVSRQIGDRIKSSDMFEAAVVAKSSILEDIRTGNFYNLERKDKIDSSILGMGDDDFAWDMDDGDDDWGSDDEDYDNWDVVADVVEKSASQSATLISDSIVGMGEYQAEVTKATSAHTIGVLSGLMGGMSAQLENIGQNLSIGVDNSREYSTAMLDNTKSFFEESILLQRENNALMKEYMDMQRNLYSDKQESSSSSSSIKYGDIFSYDGSIDATSYAKSVMNNINTTLSSVTGMGDMFEEGNIWLSFAASPLEFVPKYIVSQLIDKNLDGSIKSLDKSLGGFFSAMATKINSLANDTDNMFLSKIGEIFGVSNTLNLSVATDKYEKGPVPWDGKARKALIEVIPTYLSQLVSLQSGKPSTVYDYNMGKFVSSKDIKDNFDNAVKSSISSATGDYKDHMTNSFNKSFKFSDLNDKENFESDMDTFFEYFFKTQNIVDYNNKKDVYEYEGLSLKNNDNFGLFNNLFANMPKDMQLNFYKDIMQERESFNSTLRDIELSGDSTIHSLNNNSILDNRVIKGASNPLAEARDSKGHSTFDYLSNILNVLMEGIIVYPASGGFGDGSDPDGIPPNIRGRKLADNTLFSKDYTNNQIQTSKDAGRRNYRSAMEEKTNLVDIDNTSSDEFMDILRQRSISDKIEQDAKDKRNTKESLAERLMGETSLYKKGILLKENVLTKPQNIISDVLNKVDNRLFEIIYGDPSKDDDTEDANGFLELMVLNMRDTFENINTWIDEKILSPLSEKSDTMFRGIFNFLGIDYDERGAIRTIRNSLFGEMDEEGEYTKKGILSDISYGVKKELTKAKDFVFGSNRHIRAIANIINDYNNDPTLHNKFDQMALIQDIGYRLFRVNTISVEEKRVVARIKRLIESKSEDNPETTINNISQVLSSSGYTIDNTSMLGIATDTVKNTFNDFFKPKNEMDKVMDLLTGTGRTANAVDLNLSVSTHKFDPLYEFIKTFVFLSEEEQFARVEEIQRLIINIEPSTEEEVRIKDKLVDIYNAGASSADIEKMIKDILKLYQTSLGKSNSLTILNIAKKGATNISKTGKDAFGKAFDTFMSDPNNTLTIGGKDDTLSKIKKEIETEGSYEKGKYRVDGEEEVVKVHQGERILNKQDASDFNSIIDKLKLIRDGKGSDKDADELMGYISSLIGDFKPKNTREGIMKAQSLDAIANPDRSAGLNELASVLGVEIGNADSIQREMSIVDTIKLETKNQFNTFKEVLFGKGDEDEIKEQTEATILDFTKELGRDYKEMIPKGIAGGIIGGGLGLLPGLIGGPLAWATIGAGVNIVKSSETAQEILFGKTDDDGERKGGVISKDIMDTVQRFYPNAVKGATFGLVSALLPITPFGLAGGLTLGATAGILGKTETFQDMMFGEDSLFGPDGKEKIKDGVTKSLPGGIAGTLLGGMVIGGPLGLMGGALLGGAGSYLSTTETFKEMMFGTEDEDGMLGYKNMDRLKEILPASAVSTLAIGAIGPFGLLGSTVLGTVTGIATTSDHFKDTIFGEMGEDGLRHGGFMESAKEKMSDFVEKNIKEPFNSALDPIKYEMKSIGRSIKDSIKISIDSVFEKAIGMPLGEMVQTKIIEPFTAMTQKFFSGIGRILGTIISSPFKAIKYIGDELRDKHESQGISYGDNTITLDDVTEEKKETPKDKVNKAMDTVKGKATSVIDSTKESIDKNRMKTVDDAGITKVEPKVIPINRKTPEAKTKENTNDEGEPPSTSEQVKSVLSDGNVRKVDPIKELQVGPSQSHTSILPDISSSMGNASIDAEKQEKEAKDKKRSNDYLKDIRDEVFGQLDGVGYNIEKIKNILANSLGDADATEMDGRGNKKRRGLLGRILDFARSPLDAIGGMLTGIKDSIANKISVIGDVIMAPFNMLGGAVKTVVGGLKSAGKLVTGFITETGKFMLEGAKTFAKITGSILEGVGKAAGHVIEGVGLMGKGLLSFAGKIPDMASSLVETAAKGLGLLGKGVIGTGKLIGKGVGAVGRGIGTGLDMLFNRDKIGKANHMDVTVIGGTLNTVEVVKKVEGLSNNKNDGSPTPPMPGLGLVDNVIDATDRFVGKDTEDKPSVTAAALPTKFGNIQFKKAVDGSMVPIKDKVFKMFNKEEESKSEEMALLHKNIQESTEAGKETAESVSIFNPKKNKNKDGMLAGIFGGIGGLAKTILPILAPLALMVLPKLSGIIGGKLGEMLPESRFKSNVMEPFTNISEKSGVELAAKNVVFGKNIGAKAIRKGTEKVVETAGPKVIQTIASTVQKIFTSEKLVSAITKILPDSGAEICNTLASKLGPQIAEAAGEAGASAIATKMASNMFVVLAVGLMVTDFAQGMSRAEEILKMDGDLPIKFKVIAGLANAINNRLTLGLVPLKWILELLIKVVGTKEEKQNIQAAKDKLTQGYKEYQESERAEGTEEEDMMSFDEFNRDINAKGFRKRRNKKKYQKRIKKNKKRRKEDDIVEDIAEESEGYGFGLPFRGVDDEFDYDKDGCGIRAMDLVLNAGMDKRKEFDKATRFMDRDKGLHPNYFKDYANKNGMQMKISDTEEMRDYLRKPNVIVSTKVDGRPHYLVTGQSEGDTIELIDPDTGEKIYHDINDLVENSNFTIDMSGKKSNAREFTKKAISTARNVTRVATNPVGTMVDKVTRPMRESFRNKPQPQQPTVQASDSNKDLLIIIVSLLKEMIKYASGIDTIIEVISGKTGQSKKDIQKNNASILNVLDSISSSSTEDEISAAAKSILSIAAK